MRHIFRMAVVVMSAVLLPVLSGCREEKVYKIGISQCSRDDWRSKMNEEIRRETMFHKDAYVEIRSADDSSEKQIEDIRYFVERGFDMVIVAPNEASALTPVVKEVYESGMPVVIFDRNINGDHYTARISVDNTALGRAAARYALHLVGSRGNALELYGLPGSTPADQRHEGFESHFTSHGGRIVATGRGDWNPEKAIASADSLLRRHPEINVIFAHNDRMAIGASEVARRLGRDDIRIIGIDAAPEIGIRAVADSVIDATFLYPTDGHRIVRLALDILHGRPYERETMLPVASAVDKSNADILLLQNETLKDETAKIRMLKSQIDDYWEQHSAQSWLFYSSIVIILLLLGVVFLILRLYWQHKSHRNALMAQNQELAMQSEQQRVLNDQLRQATQSKLRFFTNVSHDLRTPLSLIAEPVAQLAAAGNLTERQKTLITLADKNVRILKRLINQILDFRKYENGKMKIELEEVDFGRLLGEWCDSFQTLALKRHIKLTFNIEGNGQEMSTLAVDAGKMERVFFNLMSNAFKFTPENGSIVVTYICEEKEAGFSVADSGCGISERDLSNIFDRFYQAERVHPDGSGIGLSVCKAFVELHNGSISVESEPDKGSVFTVRFPVLHVSERTGGMATGLTREDVASELGEEESEHTMSDSRPLVLVVDDNHDIQILLARLLEDRYNVITASNGAEGIKRAIRYVPDLVICDVMMPGIDGLECCRRLKSEMATSHIPVLMLTACSMDEQRIQGYDSGADGYLSKPFGEAVLKSRVESLLSNRRRLKAVWQSSVGHAGVPEAVAAAPKQSGATRPADLDNEFYNRFIEIFTPELGNSDISVEELASRMGFERTQFYRKIKALTNYSPVELIRRLRLKEAHRMLKATERSVGEIAYATGFSTPAYFTRCYREQYGETPTETRSKMVAVTKQE